MNITSTAKFAIGTLWEQLETDREISEMALENGRMVIITLKTEAAGDPTAFQD